MPTLRSSLGLAPLALVLTITTAAHAADTAIQSMTQDAAGVRIVLTTGVLKLLPLTESTVRVRFTTDGHPAAKSIVLINPGTPPTFKVADTPEAITLSTTKMRVRLDRATGALSFADATGHVFLAEDPKGRRLEDATIQDEPTHLAEQAFLTPKDEHLFGSGQFQDGELDVRDLPRRLTQVNSQIAIPFLLSSKGYGLLWHNYGLSDLNPANQHVGLTATGKGPTTVVDVTTTEGTKHETRQDGEFTGSFLAPSTGLYALQLDIGAQMAKRYHVEIDGKTVLDFANRWLPPTTSWHMQLSAGPHAVRVLGETTDAPSLFLRPAEDRTVWRSPVADAIDYVVFAGPKSDDIIAAYRQLSGPAPLMPIWAYGYIHCRERFHSSDEITETTAEFRKRNLPMDLIVQDWQYWGKYGWNAMQWDEDHYPDPAKLVADVHAQHAHLMVSVWSKIVPTSLVGKEFTAKNYYIPGTQWIDFFNPAAAGLYWQNFSKRMLSLGIDAWWQDADEPENDALHNRRIYASEGKTQPGETMRLAYPLMVTKTVYEGQRKDEPSKRVMILSRSAFLGEQRYASTVWSGDIGSDWETLRRQVTAGLDYMASGLPYWTTDGGGFFRPGPGQYTDPAYQQRFLRWLQFATFSPLQRVHGYQTDTEPWRFGPEVESESRRYLELRSRLLPYLYSQAAEITLHGSTLMRPLVMDFASDPKALAQKYEYMFGPAFLVAPVLEPNVKRTDVYLPPAEGGWFDYWTDRHAPGASTITVETPISQIPLMVRAGSILPLGPVEQYAGEKPDAPIELRIYPGTDGDFTLYEDEGTNYNYEKGQRATVQLHWKDSSHELTFANRVGSFTGMQATRQFNLVLIGVGVHAKGRTVTYTGKLQTVKLAAK